MITFTRREWVFIGIGLLLNLVAAAVFATWFPGFPWWAQVASYVAIGMLTNAVGDATDKEK